MKLNNSFFISTQGPGSWVCLAVGKMGKKGRQSRGFGSKALRHVHDLTVKQEIQNRKQPVDAPLTTWRPPGAFKRRLQAHALYYMLISREDQYHNQTRGKPTVSGGNGTSMKGDVRLEGQACSIEEPLGMTSLVDLCIQRIGKDFSLYGKLVQEELKLERNPGPDISEKNNGEVESSVSLRTIFHMLPAQCVEKISKESSKHNGIDDDNVELLAFPSIKHLQLRGNYTDIGLR